MEPREVSPQSGRIMLQPHQAQTKNKINLIKLTSHYLTSVSVDYVNKKGPLNFFWAPSISLNQLSISYLKRKRKKKEQEEFVSFFRFSFISFFV